MHFVYETPMNDSLKFQNFFIMAAFAGDQENSLTHSML